MSTKYPRAPVFVRWQNYPYKLHSKNGKSYAEMGNASEITSPPYIAQQISGSCSCIGRKYVYFSSLSSARAEGVINADQVWPLAAYEQSAAS